MSPETQIAPDPLRVVGEFVNTLDIEKPETDALISPESATTWFRDHGLLTADERVDADGLELLGGFREALRRELLAHTGEGNLEETWAALRGYAERASVRICCGAGPNTLAVTAEGEGTQRAIGRLFAIIYQAIQAGRWPRLKACLKNTCLFAFYDQSKNGSGRWCSMAVCGNRAKAQRRRAREAS